ncbi:MAG: lipoprotein [Gammaproteobacteria bacterium]
MNACREKYIIWLLTAAMALSGLLSACGQKGDLYLPDQKPAPQTNR